MPVFFVSLIYAASAALFGMLAGHAIEKRDYRVAGLWTATALGLLVNGALHINRIFIGVNG